jgi:hypothetical protein
VATQEALDAALRAGRVPVCVGRGSFVVRDDSEV